MIPPEVKKSLRDAVEAYEVCEGILYSVWQKCDYRKCESHKYTRWLPWSVANELRYAGQHVCRFLCHNNNAKRDAEIEKIKGHCCRADYDAHDYVILCLTRYILHRLSLMEEKVERTRDTRGIYTCNVVKREFGAICNALAKNNRKNGNFIECRAENTARLLSLFCIASGEERLEVSPVPPSNSEVPSKSKLPRPKLSPAVVGPSKRTPTEIYELFNNTEANLKKYELISGTACVSGINKLFAATCCLIDDNDELQEFTRRCYLAQIHVLLEIVAYYRNDLKIYTAIEDAFSENADESILQLQEMITHLEELWYSRWQ